MIPYFVLNQFNLGPITLYAWGLFVGLGFSAGYLLLLYSAKQKNLALEKVVGLALAIFLGGALGSKILPVALLPGGFFNNINLLFSQHSGSMFMGGLLGAILFVRGYIKLARLNFWEMVDLLVLPTALGIAIGRIGCILINDHQGAVTSLPWGILWPDGVLRHPVGVYEFLVGLALFGIFWWGKKGLLDRLENSGFLFLLFLMSCSVIRFLLDFTRESQGLLADPCWGIFSISQWVAVIIFVTSSALFIYKKKC